MNDKICIIISGPSGVGKSTIIREMISRNSNMTIHKSITTRLKRHESDDFEYDFLSVEEFENKIKQNKFLEYFKLYDNYYGKYHINNQTEHKYIIFNIDINGAMSLFEKIKTPYISIFISPPCINTLYNRLCNRNTNDNITQRMKNAQIELNHSHKFSHNVVNNVLNDTVDEINMIINSYIIDK